MSSPDTPIIWGPDGPRPMTDAEAAQFRADQAAWAALTAAAQQLDANAATMADRVNQALTNLEDAAKWAALTPAQRDNQLRLVIARLARLVLHRLDTAT